MASLSCDAQLCNDGLFCNGTEICDAVQGCQAGTPPYIDDGVGCTDDTCDEATDSIVNAPNDANCDNGLFCDGAETCDAVQGCQAGTPPSTNDGIVCTDDTCDEATDSIVNAPNDANCDNGLFCDGAETCDAALDCQAGTPPDTKNTQPYSRDLTNAVWAGTATAAYDQAGLTGEPNTASLCADSSGSAENLIDFQTIPDDSNVHVARFFVKKDTDQARFPEFDLNFIGGTTQYIAFQINTQTGTSAIRTSTGTVANEVTDAGDWWVVLISVVNNSTGNTTLIINIRPAASTSLGGWSAAATGSIIIGNVETYLNSTIAAVRGLGPIFTTSAAIDGVGCTDDTCDEATDSIVNAPNDANCDNGLFCDGAETCDAVQGCQAGTPPNATDGVTCTDDTCDEATDSIVNAPNDANCDNGLFCDGAETCDAALDCQAGTPPDTKNTQPYSRDLTNAVWAGTATAAYDQAGLTGEPNTASLCADSSGSAENLIDFQTIPDDSNVHVARFL